MITNDNELRITRERLRLAEAALDACRRDFLPHNEVQYRLFSGTTIDLIQSIRADIDAYLGIGLEAGREPLETEGVIRQIDLDEQTFVLRDRPEGQPDLHCEYPTTLADRAKGLLGRRVQVSGLLETSRVTQRLKLQAVAIEPLEGERAGMSEGAAVTTGP